MITPLELGAKYGLKLIHTSRVMPWTIDKQLSLILDDGRIETDPFASYLAGRRGVAIVIAGPANRIVRTARVVRNKLPALQIHVESSWVSEEWGSLLVIKHDAREVLFRMALAA